jgi:hypothetical protein
VSIEVRSWPTPAALLANLGEIDEVRGCVVHGMAHAWLARPEAFRAGTPLLTAVSGGAVVAAAIQASIGKAVFSLAPTEAILALARWWEEAGRRPRAAVVPEAARQELRLVWPGQPTLETTLYKIETPPPTPRTAGRLRPAEAEDAPWLIDWVADFSREARLPDDPKPRLVVEAKLTARHLFVWDDGVPRAIAALAGPTPRAVRINTVYAPDAFRRRGFGSAAVAALTRQELESGRAVVLLFADRALAHTNRMYRSLGFEAVADFVDLALDAAQARPTQSPIA